MPVYTAYWEGPVMHQALADAKQEAQAVMGAMFKLAALQAGGEEGKFSVSSFQKEKTEPAPLTLP